MVRGVLATVAVAILLVLPGCASAAEPPSDVDLFGEYARSTNVKNDVFPSDGMGPEDRLANLASLGTPEQVRNRLLFANECGEDCGAGSAVRAAGRDFGGTLYIRRVLVKHADGSLELVRLYVAQKSEKDAVLIDPQGKTYQDLADFQANNEVLTAEDLVLLPENITSVPGEGRVVTVYGHTTTDWLPWVIGGLAVVVVLGAGLVVRRRIRARRTSG